MKFNKSLVTAAILAVGSLAAVSANAAGTVSDTFDVKITITSVCDVATGATPDINFGSNVAAGAATTVQSAAIKVQCSNGTPFVINMSPTGTSTVGIGNMTNTSADSIPFKLTKDSAGNTPWGNLGSLGTEANGVAGTGAGMTVAKAVTKTVYATVTGTNSTDVLPGTYSNTVTVAVIY